MSAIREIHEAAPEFGYRFIADELVECVFLVSGQRVWRLCHGLGVISVIASRKGCSVRAGASVGEDLLQRHFHADTPNIAWVTDITEHWTRGGKLYVRPKAPWVGSGRAGITLRWSHFSLCYKRVF